MALSWEKQLERWQSAGVVDAGTAARIRAFETQRGSGEGLRWPVLLAVALGGVLLGAGVLLFVAAHWDQLSPGARFALVLLMVALFPCAGALVAERFRALSTTFYAVGTVCAGAGIFLSAQIFNVEEHWPSGIMLWALAALAGWILLREWPQAALLAVLAPVWLAGEWFVRTEGYRRSSPLVWEGLFLLAVTYLTAESPDRDSSVRRALVWLGGIALLPIPLILLSGDDFFYGYAPQWQPRLPLLFRLLGWAVALGVPLALAFWLRRKAAWMNLLAAVWIVVLRAMHPQRTAYSGYAASADSFFAYVWHSLGPYVWCAAGAVALIVWGLAEKRRERINLGVLGFALTVAIFYFSNVMDKLGRSASLIGLGLLFLLGGWSLERARRSLVARVKESNP